MVQHHDGAAPLAVAAPYSRGPSKLRQSVGASSVESAYTQQSYVHGQGPSYNNIGPSPGPSLSPTSGTGSYSSAGGGEIGIAVGTGPGSISTNSSLMGARAAKEREAYTRYGGRPGLGLATPAEDPFASGHGPEEAGSSADLDRRGSAVVVHRDAGRVKEDEEEQLEIPPTYDSIRE